MDGFHVIFAGTLWIYIQMTGIVECCYERDHDVVENAFLNCRTNDTCEAQCDRGYIFPTGKTNTNYSCQDGGFSDWAHSCKHIPVVNITYTATWNFYNVMPGSCGNISALQMASGNLTEKMLKLCDTLPVDVNMTFTYTTLSFMINTTFVGKYFNFSSSKFLERCYSLHLEHIKNQTLPFIDSLFGDIICGNETINHSLWVDLHSDRQLICPLGTEVKNVKDLQDDEDSNEHFCDTPDSSRENSSQDFATIVNSTSIHFGFTTESTDISLKTTYFNWESPSQTFTGEINSTLVYDGSTTVSKVLRKRLSSPLTEGHSGLRCVYYITGLAAGILLFSSLIIIIVVACQRKSLKSTEENLQGNEMAELERSFGTSFEGILIENEFYQSADDVPIVSYDTGDYSTALPYYKPESETNLTSDENHYSYATPILIQIGGSNDESKNETKRKTDEKHYSLASSSSNKIFEICQDACKEENKEENISAETVVEGQIERNEVNRDSCQYTLIDKSFKTKV